MFVKPSHAIDMVREIVTKASVPWAVACSVVHKGIISCASLSALSVHEIATIPGVGVVYARTIKLHYQ